MHMATTVDDFAKTFWTIWRPIKAHPPISDEKAGKIVGFLNER